MAIESKKIKIDAFVNECSVLDEEIAVPFDFDDLTPIEKQEIIKAAIADQIHVTYKVKK